MTSTERQFRYAFLLALMCIPVLLLMGMREAPPRPEACDCPTVRLDDAYCYAEMVFEGVPVAMDTVFVQGGMKNSSGSVIDHVVVRFRVERLIKGPGTSMVGMVDVTSSEKNDNCVYLFVPGMKYLVFATLGRGMLVTDQCTPTRNMDTITRGFADSLDYVMEGHQWAGRVPLDKPCR